MSNLMMMVLCLLAGLALRRTARVPESAHQVVNVLILHVSLPALTLVHLRRMEWDADHVAPVLMPWLLFGIGAALFWWSGRRLGLSAPTVGALTLVAGLGNTSFVGLPMVEALHGADGLGLGLLVDQLGSYLALSTVGIALAMLYGCDRRPAWPDMLRRVVTFPPLVALVLAVLLRPVPLPAALETALLRVGDTVAPLALLSVGLQLRLGAWRALARPLALGLGYKLLVCPALVIGLLMLLDLEPGMAQRVAVIEAAMPPMIGAAVVATQSGLDARLATLLIGIGIPLSLSTAPLWHVLYQAVAG